ncbi:hypothetical protein [Saccharothrix carnea]|uniref:rhamnogalacturonan endolyase family protein n=1 Tax=Saccharothrix carnea TaxID=1280637 RepID=UPI002481E073|nr:hypothetical protein [Saccharothrix carnea]
MTSSVLVAGAVAYPAAGAAPDVPQAERLDRGLISVHTRNGNFVNWRLLTGDARGTAFNVYRDGLKVTSSPITRTNFQDHGALASAVYTVRPVVSGVEQAGAA